MRREDIEDLATYNTEVGDGKVFPLEVQERMAALQDEFDEWAAPTVLPGEDPGAVPDLRRRRRRIGHAPQRL